MPLPKPHVKTVRDTFFGLRHLIEEAGREPVERDTLYHRVERNEGSAWRSGEAIATT